MNEHDRQIEREIEANEAWLSGFKTPAPSTEAINRAKQAVHRELARRQGAATVRSWNAWHGALGAAAALALCITVGWYTINRQPTQRPEAIVEIDEQPILAESTEQEVIVLADMDDDLTDLEDWSPEQTWSAGGADLFHALEETFEEDSTTQPTRSGPSKTIRTQG